MRNAMFPTPSRAYIPTKNLSPLDLHYKVHIFWEGHKILQNLHRRFDWHYIGQIYGRDFVAFSVCKKSKHKKIQNKYYIIFEN